MRAPARTFQGAQPAEDVVLVNVCALERIDALGDVAVLVVVNHVMRAPAPSPCCTVSMRP